jgi:hypothetical protein
MPTITPFTVGGRDIVSEGGMCFLGKIVITDGSISPSQVVTFGSLDYVVDHNDELFLIEDTFEEDCESPMANPL